MKKSIILLLILFLISVLVEAQQPIPITSLARSSNPLMIIQTNANRYQSYQYFTTAWGDTLLNFMQANPNWLGTYLPAGAVNIAAAGNNLQFTQGGTFRWTSDTTSLGEWIPQFTVSPLLSGGLINQRLIGVGSLANKYIGTSGQDNIGLYVDGYPDIYLRNQQIQDTSLAAGNYYTRVDEEGKVDFVPYSPPIITNNVFSRIAYLPDTGKVYSISGFLLDTINKRIQIGEENAIGFNSGLKIVKNGGDAALGLYRYSSNTFAPKIEFIKGYGTASAPSNIANNSKNGTISWFSYYGSANRVTLYMDGEVTALNPDSTIEGRVTFRNDLGQSVLDISSTKDIFLSQYDSTFNSPEQPVNMISTGALGIIRANPLSEIFQYASFEVTGTNDAYTGQEPIHGWNQIGTSGVTGNITIQGDTMFQFPTTGVYEVEFNLILYSLATQSDFTLSINNVTDVTGFGTGSMEGQTQLNGGLEFTVKYILTASSGSAQFTQDLLGTGVGTIVRTGSRCNIKRLY